MTVAHTVVGRGPVHVMTLHGWFGSATGWGMLPELVDADRYAFAFFDYRGYGQRIDKPGDFTLEEIAADAIALADELGWERFAVLGHSMGGVAALRVFADAAPRITAVIGISPVPASGVELDTDGRALFEGAEDTDDNRYAIIDFTTGNRLSPTWIAQMTRSSVQNSTRQAVGAYLPAWAGANFAEELPHPAVPVVAIVGEHDPALGAQTMRTTWLTQLPGCRLEVLANAGHYSMFETPVALMTSIEKILDSVR